MSKGWKKWREEPQEKKTFLSSHSQAFSLHVKMTTRCYWALLPYSPQAIFSHLHLQPCPCCAKWMPGCCEYTGQMFIPNGWSLLPPSFLTSFSDVFDCFRINPNTCTVHSVGDTILEALGQENREENTSAKRTASKSSGEDSLEKKRLCHTGLSKLLLPPLLQEVLNESLWPQKTGIQQYSTGSFGQLLSTSQLTG